MATEALRYRPRAMVRVGGSVLYFTAQRVFEDFSYEPALAEMLARWDRFQPLDQALVTAFGGTDFQRVSHDLKVLEPAGGSSWAVRITARLMEWANRQQVRRTETSALFVQMKARLERLIDEDLLLSSDALLAPSREADHACHAQGHDGVPSRIEAIGLATRDRPQVLQRSLESLLQNARLHSRHVRVVVTDLSISESNHAANKALLQSLERDYGQPIRYCDDACRRNWVKRLIARGIPSDVARDTVSGALRRGDGFNALVLETVNSRALIGDDSCSYQPVSHHAKRSSLIFTEDPTYAAWFFGPSERPRFECEGTDVLAIYESTLGRTLQTIAAEWPCRSNVDVDRLCSHMLRGFLENRGRVAVCTAGTVGRSSVERLAAWWRSAPSPLRRRVAADLRRHRRRADALEMLTVPLSDAISHTVERPFSAAFALDNTSLGVPIVSLGGDDLRGDGGELFRRLLHSCVPDAYIAHAPYGFADEPPPAETNDAPIGERHLSFGRIVAACLSFADLALDGLDTTQRLRRAGSALVECGSLRTEAIDEQLGPRLLERSARDLAEWEGFFKGISTCQPDWGRRIRAWIDARSDAMRRAEYAVARELAADGDIGAARRLTQSLLVRTGQVLRWWPDIVAIAREAQGTGAES